MTTSDRAERQRDTAPNGPTAAGDRTRANHKGGVTQDTAPEAVPSVRRSRVASWRNMLIAAINAGLEQDLFGLDADDYRGPEDGCIYHFDFAGMPASAFVAPDGPAELRFHVAVRPTGQFIEAMNGGFDAGDAFALGWLEQGERKGLEPVTEFFNVRRELLPMIATAEIQPKGYSVSAIR